jgi:hypothetical protein
VVGVVVDGEVGQVEGVVVGIEVGVGRQRAGQLDAGRPLATRDVSAGISVNPFGRNDMHHCPTPKVIRYGRCSHSAS